MKTYIDVTDPETGEVFQLRSDTLVGNIRDMFMARRRMDIQATTWSKLTHDQQQSEISAVTGMAQHLVNAIVELVAQAGRPVVHATLKKYGVKDGVVELTAAGLAEDEVVLSLNRVGKKVIKIIVADAEQFDQSRPKLEAQPDQPSLPIEVEVTPMTEAEEEAIAAEMDEALDGMDMDEAEATLAASDAEDLHAAAEEEAESPSLPDEDGPTAEQMGFNARINGFTIKSNPFDFAEEDKFNEWEAGYNSANTQIAQIRDDAINAIETEEVCPYKPGGFAATLWGNIQAAAQMAVPDNATKSGALAAESGLPLDANPFLEKPHSTFWMDGWIGWMDSTKSKGA